MTSGPAAAGASAHTEVASQQAARDLTSRLSQAGKRPWSCPSNQHREAQQQHREVQQQHGVNASGPHFQLAPNAGGVVGAALPLQVRHLL